MRQTVARTRTWTASGTGIGRKRSRQAARDRQRWEPVALRPVTKLPASHVGAGAVALAAVSNSSRTVLAISSRYKQLGDFPMVDFLANGSSLFRAWRRGSSSSSRR